ncbi:hypothetical protein GC207_01840 [bacterium]|nr:hypothetical protein [bacterium]
MKTSLHFVLAAGLALTPLAVTASPLQRSQVSANAKWLLHLDVDALRKTQLGSNLLKRVVDEAGEDLKEDAHIDLPAILKNTSSVMAYGTDFKSGKDGKGVLIWQGSKEIEQIASGFLVQQAEATKAGSGNVKLVREGAEPVYAFGDDMNIMVRPGGGLVLGRSIDQIDLATKVLEGKASSLQTKDTFKEYSPLPGGFFFLALADGFAKEAQVPAQASVLKLTDGGRLALGETNGKLRLQLSLKAQSKEVTQQIQQVVQGILAVATMTQGDNPDLQNLIRDTKVSVEGQRVSVDLSVPVETALKQIDEHDGGKKQTAPAKDQSNPDESKK